MNRINGLFYTVFCICMATIGHYIHGGVFWTIMNFIFAPLSWLKWMVCHQVSISVIKAAFAFFLK